MKTFLYLLVMHIVLPVAAQNVGINNDGSAPNPKAMLDVKSNTKGLLIPRMTTTERNNITSPPEGLMVYDTDIKSFFFIKNSNWENMLGNIQLPFNGAVTYSGSAFTITNNINSAAAIAGQFYGGYGKGIHAEGSIGGYFLGTDKGIDVNGGGYFYSGVNPGVMIEMNNNSLNALIVKNGKTGYGTLNPEAKLHITDSFVGNPANLFKVTGYAGTVNPPNLVNFVYKIQQPVTFGGPMQPFLGTETNHPFHMITNNDMDHPTMSFFNNKVGINKTDGTYPLSVNGTTAFYEADQYMGQIAGNSTSGNLYISAKPEPYATSQFAKNLILQTSLDFQQRMGYVGINTLTPTAFLEVNKDGYTTGTTAKIGNSKFDMGTDNNTFIRGGNNNGIGVLYLNSDVTADVSIANGGGDVMISNPNTKVRIGTIHGNYPLNVKGIIRSEELIIETNWADYVFNIDYKLKPLEEVDAFIRAHKHLPGIATAEEIQTNGLKVAASSTKMMEKIEELTLYIIEQNKKLKQMEAAIELLKNNQNK